MFLFNNCEHLFITKVWFSFDVQICKSLKKKANSRGTEKKTVNKE